MNAHYSNKPAHLERFGNGMWKFRWNLAETADGWSCRECLGSATPNPDTVKAAALSEYPDDPTIPAHVEAYFAAQEKGEELTDAEIKQRLAWSIPVTPRQFKLALLGIDVYPDDVEAAIATIEDPRLRTAAQIEWREALSFRRDHPLLAQIAPLLGATDEMLDELFLAAQEIR